MFKIGSNYTRKDVGFVLHPNEGRPSGGNWDTGYVRVEDKLIIFMNMGVPGKTGHNYNNSYDDVTVTVNGTSIDDATPEEWNEASAYAYGKTKK